MRAADIMIEGPALIRPEDSIVHAEAILRGAHARHWPVTRDHTIVGMISLRHLMTASTLDNGDESPWSPEPLEAMHVMTRPRAALRKDDDLAHVALLMHRERLSMLPVVEEEVLVGVVTLDRLVQYVITCLQEEEVLIKETPAVSRLMTYWPLATVNIFDEVIAAERVMKEYNVRHVPVMNGARAVGIVSERDLLEWLRMTGHAGVDAWIGDVMNESLEVTHPKSSAIEAGRKLMTRSIGALPVISGDELVGIVAKSDYLRYLSTRAPRRRRTEEPDARVQFS